MASQGRRISGRGGGPDAAVDEGRVAGEQHGRAVAPRWGVLLVVAQGGERAERVRRVEPLLGDGRRVVGQRARGLDVRRQSGPADEAVAARDRELGVVERQSVGCRAIRPRVPPGQERPGVGVTRADPALQPN
jgi:hypothetical protein